MARIAVTRETKTKLLAAATSGQSIEIWMFQFIGCDPEFQAELFRTAESFQNWRFLESLSEFRAQQRRAALPPVIRPLARFLPKREFRSRKPQPARTLKGRSKLRTHQASPRRQPAPERPIIFTQLKSTDFTHCPRCKLRLLKKVLSDHLDLSCPQRGRVTGSVTSFSDEKQKVGVSVVFCHCGAPAIPGDSCCYDHKVT
jgi:hypothetical protein